MSGGAARRDAKPPWVPRVIWNHPTNCYLGELLLLLYGGLVILLACHAVRWADY